MKNYYQTLGVSENVSQDEIKRAYKKLAKENHPDVGGDEIKFKEINEAYDALKTKEKRQEYDNSRAASRNWNFNSGPRQWNFSDEDIFSEIFSSRFTNTRRFSKAQDLLITLQVSLEDVIKGKKSTIQTEIGPKEINIPPGVLEGTKFRLKGYGIQSNHPNILPGDLFVEIKYLPNPIYEVAGSNLIRKLDISVIDCMLGTSVELTTVCGKKLNLKIPECTKNNKFKLSGYGLPRNNGRGDLIVELNYILPEKLSENQKKLLAEIKREV